MSQDIFIGIQPFTGDNIYITPDASTIEQVNVNVQPFSGEQVYINVQPDTGAQVNVSVSPNMLGVYLVNGRDGAVTLDKSDVNLSNVENVSITGTSGYLQEQINNIDLSSSLTGVSGYFQNQFNNLDLNYASDLQLSQTGAALNTKIDNLSGYFNDQDVLAYTAELESGQETAFLPYPAILSQPPSSITCAFQNNIDNIIYNYSLRQINTSGFYINFSDVLTNSGYLLKIQVKR